MFRHFTLLLGCLLALAGASLAQTDAAKGSIAGRVTLQGQPVPDVLIIIAKDSYSMEKPLAQARTDADGRYFFANLTPQDYQLSPFAGPYIASGQRDFRGTSLKVSLKAGEQVRDLDFTLTRGGVITGRITDGAGKPLIRQRLTLLRVGPKGDEQLYRETQTVATDDRGLYRIYGLAAGNYVVSAGRNPREQVYGIGNRVFYPQIFHPATPKREDAKLIELAEGSEASGVDIQLGLPQTAFSASGRVVNAETGTPIAGMKIGYGKVEKGRLQGFGFDNTETGADGRFTVNGLAEGEYAAFVADFGNVKKENYSEPVTFTITENDVTDLEIKQHQGLRLSGQVVVEGATNPAQALARLPQVMVFYQPDANNVMGFAANSTTKVAPDGTFTVTGLRPGKAKLILSNATGNITEIAFSLVRLTVNGADISKGFDVVAGQNIENVLLTAEEGTCNLSGQVNFLNGTITPQDEVYLSVQRRDRPGFSRRTQLDARRTFVINGLGRGEYEVRLSLYNPSAPRRPPAPQTLRVTGTEDNIILTFDLTPQPPAPEKKP